MHKEIQNLISGIDFTGDVPSDVLKLLTVKGSTELVNHIVKVAYEAKKIAKHFGIDEEKALTAGLLHDVGRTIPADKSVEICQELGIHVFDEERTVPSLLHPKLSKVIAKEIFKADPEICSAVECHSSLKANASKLDLVLMIADKISWERPHNSDFIEQMLEGLNDSLECSAITYLEYLHSGNAEILHPWAIEAYEYLKGVTSNA